jgi:WhiB family transcriptional regulator, redox-sensing transcriptional regulator
MTTDTPEAGAPASSGPQQQATGEAGAPAAQQQTKRPLTRRRTAFERPDEDDRGWRNRGTCTGHDAELWFSPLPAMRLEAVWICEGCPVRADCLSWARKTGQRFGIWGGIDFEVAATSAGVADEAAALAATVARLPIVDRVRRLLGEFPGSTLAEVAERLGYKNGGSLQRTLYRRGDDGKALIRVLKPGSRSRERAEAEKVTFKGLPKNDPDHPWLVEAALPVNEQGANVQHRKTGKPGRKSESPASPTASEEDAA